MHQDPRASHGAAFPKPAEKRGADDVRAGRTGKKGGRRLLRWTAIVPTLTFAIFGGLCALTFVQIDWRRPKTPRRGSTARDFTAEVLARYRAETAKLGEIRERNRAGLSVEGLIRLFGRPAGADQAREPLPAREALLSDFQALRRRSPETAPELLRALVPVWRQVLEEKEPRPGERELLAELFLQAAVSLEAAPPLDDGERNEIFALCRDLLARGESGLGGVLVYLGTVATPRDAPALRELAEKVRQAQHREEIRRILERLEKRSPTLKVADAR